MRPGVVASPAPSNLSYGAVDFADAVVIVADESYYYYYAVDFHYLFVVDVYDALLN